jgi:hopanoid biosynthesis associated protein HpnK
VKRVIVTGDDFGLAVPVNEAIERAHRDGILTTASLMVSGAAAEDAVRRARRLSSLRVGLHLVLVEGRPMLPPEAVPDLVDSRGELSTQLVRAGVRFFFRPRVRQQLEAEIRAQLAAFRATGLPLDHVNAHNHMHLHPSILGLIVRIGQEFGVKAVRIPYEPLWPAWRAARRGFVGRAVSSFFLAPWIAVLRRRLAAAQLKSNEFVFGMHDSGRMTSDLVEKLVRELPDGVTEIYFHPATRRCAEIDRHMADYCHEAELAALTSPTVSAAMSAAGIQRIAFGDL